MTSPNVSSTITQATLARAAGRLNTPTLAQNIRTLRQTRSSDPIQQAQSDAIVELYDAVRQIQEAIWPMLVVIPDVSGARDAAQRSGSTTATALKSTTGLSAFRQG